MKQVKMERFLHLFFVNNFAHGGNPALIPCIYIKFNKLFPRNTSINCKLCVLTPPPLARDASWNYSVALAECIGPSHVSSPQKKSWVMSRKNIKCFFFLVFLHQRRSKWHPRKSVCGH